jgi:hypothetical protein
MANFRGYPDQKNSTSSSTFRQGVFPRFCFQKRERNYLLGLALGLADFDELGLGEALVDGLADALGLGVGVSDTTGAVVASVVAEGCKLVD